MVSAKLDTSIFATVFPVHKQPTEHLKSLIGSEIKPFSEQIMNMVKLWDNKIVNLRNELNIQSVYRKLDQFAKKDEVTEQLKAVASEDKQTQNSLL